MNSMKCVLLLDVGGTFVKSVVATLEGELLPDTENSVPINSDGSREDIEKCFATVITNSYALATYNGYEVAGIGVAFPGPCNYFTGVSLMKHKFAALYGVQLIELFRSFPEVASDIPVVFMHDVTSAVLGELNFGTARGYKNVAVVTLGTGLGFAHTIDGEIQYSELGSPLIPIYNRPYGDGVLEDYASKRGFMRAYSEVRGHTNPEGLTVAMIGGMAGNGGREALKTFEKVGTILAEELEPLLKEYNIECLLFGGQISRSFAYMEPALQPLLERVPSLKVLTTMQNLSTAAPLGILSRVRELLGVK